MFNTGTIYSNFTPLVKSPVIGYRISGEDVLLILKKLTKRNFSKDHSIMKLVELHNIDGTILDKCNVVYFKSPSEINLLSEISKKKIRVGGMVKKDSVMMNNNKIDFIITDFKNELYVTFSGTVPNLFEEEKGVVAEGFLNDNKFLVADKILAKHDENYMPPEIKKSLGE